MKQIHAADAPTRKRNRTRLDRLAQKILTEIQGSALAGDQAYRLYDLAIDVAEDVPPLDESKVDAIVRLFEKAGAKAKVSSIHVNGWFGDYDKLSMIRKSTRTLTIGSLRRPDVRDRTLYVGDSPNDEPAFAFFENSVGVGGIRRYLDRLQSPPRYITRNAGGEGFFELSQRLLRAKSR